MQPEIKSEFEKLAQEANDENQTNETQNNDHHVNSDNVLISESQEETKKILMGVIVPAFALLAPGWQVQNAECEMLADAYAQLIDKYFPDGIGKFGVEINATLVTLAIFAPRLAIPRKQQSETETEAKEKGNIINNE